MQVEAFLTKEEEPEDQYEDRFHMANHLEWDCCEPSDADELAQIRSHGNCAGEEYEYL